MLDTIVNRHTGGLENFLGGFVIACFVNRHTGGLEKYWNNR